MYIQNFLPANYHLAIFYIAILVLGLPALVVQSVIQSALESKLLAEQLRVATFSSQLIRIVLLLLGGLKGVVGITVALTLSSWLSAVCFIIIFYEGSWIKRLVKK